MLLGKMSERTQMENEGTEGCGGEGKGRYGGRRDNKK